jgi:DNA (cytosine-5)-methyltransferase 1
LGSSRNGGPKLKVLDLFCGAGGLAQGFRSAGFQIIGGADYDPDACSSFAANFPTADSIHGDIRTNAIRERIDHLANDADVIVGGPPCQAFSQVRNHSRIIQDPRNSLYREFVDVVKHAAPMAFVMENVPGLDQMGVKEQVLDDLSCEGAYVVRAQLLDAVDFGVPQTRKRLLFLGVRRDLRIAPPIPLGSALAPRSPSGVSFGLPPFGTLLPRVTGCSIARCLIA